MCVTGGIIIYTIVDTVHNKLFQEWEGGGGGGGVLIAFKCV